MMAGIKDILIISTPRDINFFKNLFGDGKIYGINLNYDIQEKPNGIAEALIIGEKFVGNCPLALILGDNFFYGNNLEEILVSTSKKNISTIFAYPTFFKRYFFYTSNFYTLSIFNSTN